MPQGLWLPNRRLIEIYNYYRLLLSLSLAVAVTEIMGTDIIGGRSPELFQIASYSYLF